MSTLIERVKDAGLPRHVALIMDGNGRWADAHGLPRTAGHQAGAQAAERLIRFVGRQLGLKYLTLFAFSTENWNRSAAEVNFLLDLLDQFIAEKLKEFVAEGVRLVVSGELEDLPKRLQKTVAYAIEQTADNDRLVLNVALNYGSRQEVVRACREIVRTAVAGQLRPEDLDEATFTRFLYTDGIPDPDLIFQFAGDNKSHSFGNKFLQLLGDELVE